MQSAIERAKELYDRRTFDAGTKPDAEWLVKMGAARERCNAADAAYEASRPKVAE